MPGHPAVRAVEGDVSTELNAGFFQVGNWSANRSGTSSASRRLQRRMRQPPPDMIRRGHCGPQDFAEQRLAATGWAMAEDHSALRQVFTLGMIRMAMKVVFIAEDGLSNLVSGNSALRSFSHPGRP